MERSPRYLFTSFLGLALASAAAASADPAPGTGAPSETAIACCAAARYRPSLIALGESVRLRVTDTQEGWTWESPAMDGVAVAHRNGEGACAASVVDMDADQHPEVILTLSDGAPGGAVWIFKRKAGEHAFAPIPCEVGPGLKPRDFMVWDMPGAKDAPVTIDAFGHIEIQGRLFSLLNQSTGEGTFRYRVSRGMVRHLETVASKPAGN